MGFTIKTTAAGGDFTLAPAGTHNAVCTRLIDLGTDDGGLYGPKRQIMIGWELEERDPTFDNARFMVFGYYTLSMNEKANLRKLLTGWRGKDYADDEDVDIASIVGRPCMLTVVHAQNQQGNTRAKVNAASPLPKGLEALTPEGDTICLNLEPGEFDSAEFEKLSERLQERLRQTPEWQALTDGPQKNPQPVAMEATGGDDLNDDIPF